MQYEAILFDLDGTLLPMDMNVFMKGYFGELAKKLSPVGIAPDALISAVWAGTKAMQLNDGSATNCDVFWKRFVEITGLEEAPFRAASDTFYSNEFHNARKYAGENPLAKEAVRLAHMKAEKVVLATNPFFPMAGQRTRLSWIGLSPENFNLVTAYETDCYCKPNPKYYLSVCERLNLDPEKCLMIGNDVHEDMQTAWSVGMDCFLVTDYMIPGPDYKWHGHQGTFKDLIEYLKA